MAMSTELNIRMDHVLEWYSVIHVIILVNVCAIQEPWTQKQATWQSHAHDAAKSVSRRTFEWAFTF